MAFLDGKVAIVTGAAQGLGEAFAHSLAAEGAVGTYCRTLGSPPWLAWIVSRSFLTSIPMKS